MAFFVHQRESTFDLVFEFQQQTKQQYNKITQEFFSQQIWLKKKIQSNKQHWNKNEISIDHKKQKPKKKNPKNHERFLLICSLILVLNCYISAFNVSHSVQGVSMIGQCKFLVNIFFFCLVGKFVHPQWPSHSLFSPACFWIVIGIILSAESINWIDTFVFNYHANYILWANEWSVYCVEKKEAETKGISHSEALHGLDIIDQFKWKPNKNVFMRKWLNDFQDTFPWSRAHDYNHSRMVQTE